MRNADAAGKGDELSGGNDWMLVEAHDASDDDADDERQRQRRPLLTASDTLDVDG